MVNSETLAMLEADLDKDTLMMLVGVFADEAVTRSMTIADALAAGNVRLAAEEAHALKGSSGTFGAEQIARTALAIEKAGKEGDLVTAQTAFVPLSEQIEAAIRAYQALGYL